MVQCFKFPSHLSLESIKYPCEVQIHLMDDAWPGFESTPRKRVKTEDNEEEDEGEALKIPLRNEKDGDNLQQKLFQVLRVRSVDMVYELIAVLGVLF